MEKKSGTRMNVEAGRLLKARAVRRTSDFISLYVPADCKHKGSLTLKKEDGLVKGFEYRCVCGHTDEFVCE